MSPTRKIVADIPEKLQFLYEPSRYKVLYGGRGGLKSYGCTDALLFQGIQRYERVLCARETMDSIDESVHQLLEKRIYDLGLKEFYQIMKYTIRGPEWPEGPTEFIFAGLRHNVHNIKSLEGITTCWVEEAEAVSKHSWDTLLPTVRWENKEAKRQAEIWITFNPRLRDDETYKRWVLNPPPNAKVVQTSHRDNPWFPEVLRIDMEHMKATDYETYLNVWEGEPISTLAGAIYAKEYGAAKREKRITSVPYDRSRPVHTYWDLGYGDKTAIWFVQQVGGWWNFIDYLENSGEPLSWYLIEMQRRGYVYGTDYLPHDGVDAMIHSKLASDRSKSPDMVLRGMGRRVQIAPKLAIKTGIDAVRTVFPQCRFDEDKCSEGLTALQLYQWGEPAASGQERTKPLHDRWSHGADALRTFGVSAKPERLLQPKPARDPYAPHMTKTPWS